jgi:GAF domain-containing protein
MGQRLASAQSELSAGSGSRRLAAAASVTMFALIGTFLRDVNANLVAGLVAALILAAAGLCWRRWGLSSWRRAWARRAFEKNAPVYVELLLIYTTHLRDVMSSFWRAHGEPPEQVRERIRRDILEPIRGFIPTLPGEKIKVVWFRPETDGRCLYMCEQVGHTPEGQELMRLPIGSGLAGRAFTTGSLVYSPDVDADDRFEAVEMGAARGSIACAPIERAREVSGVLSVMSTCKDAFWASELRYFEALAAAIAAIETLEQHHQTTDTTEQEQSQSQEERP